MEHGPVGPLTALVAVLTLPIGLLTGILVSVELAAAVFVVGWLLLVPLIPIVGDGILGLDDRFSKGVAQSADPVAEIKERYVRGEFSEAEFERRIDRLLDTEEPGRPDSQIEVMERESAVE